MNDGPIVKVKAKGFNPKNKSNNESLSKNQEEKRESFKMKDSKYINPKVTKIQEKNINDNYGRIYIQEGQKNKPNFLKISEPDTKFRGYQNKNNQNTTVYRGINNNPNTNHNNRYANSLDKKSFNYNRERENRKSQNYNLRRKSIDRGDNKNVQITHIIYSNMDIDFHITDPLEITTEESRRKYMGSVDKNNKNGKSGKVKVTYSSSCENVKIIPKQKNSNIGKIEYMKHRENPHLKRINNNNNNNNNNNKSNVINNYSRIYSVKNSNPLNKNQKRKYN